MTKKTIFPAWSVLTCEKKHKLFILASHIRTGDMLSTFKTIALVPNITFERAISDGCPECHAKFVSLIDNHAHFWVQGVLTGRTINE